MDEYNLRALNASVEQYIGKDPDQRFSRLSDLVIECAQTIAPTDPVLQARLYWLNAGRGFPARTPSCADGPAYRAEHREVARYARTFSYEVHLILLLSVLDRLDALQGQD